MAIRNIPGGGSHTFDCGWVLREIELDEEGRDSNGWPWRAPAGKRLFHCHDPECFDSVTLAADSMADAVTILIESGMPPKKLGKLNYHTGASAKRPFWHECPATKMPCSDVGCAAACPLIGRIERAEFRDPKPSLFLRWSRASAHLAVLSVSYETPKTYTVEVDLQSTITDGIQSRMPVVAGTAGKALERTAVALARIMGPPIDQKAQGPDL